MNPQISNIVLNAMDFYPMDHLYFDNFDNNNRPLCPYLLQNYDNTQTATSNHPFVTYIENACTYESLSNSFRVPSEPKQDKDQGFLTKEEPNTSMKLSDGKRENMEINTSKWSKEEIETLLKFLKKQKHVIKKLVKGRGGCGNIKSKLWLDVSKELSYKKEPQRCDEKWKNILRSYKKRPNFKYKSEVKEILE
ncbi:8424_t:CDS:2 [Funneliformis geosporum]|uniref:6414_t:CDS:1 n=1 Tax=Funneliformis geosporum TaxID=1117311 RepID=A0A9W4SHK4_9GLOM|nr:8424_t:CDS:2 [Funneliformis geosporum]CAI2169993.1 6414_t:CDS:2 [Funneliformis geosporum]